MFVGEGCLALVPSHLPCLKLLWLLGSYNMCDKYVEELAAAAPELKVVDYHGKIVRSKHLETI